MKDERKLEYLEEERKKLWAKVVSLEDQLTKKTSDYEADAKGSSKKASEFRNRSEEAKEATLLNFEATTSALEQIKTIQVSAEESNNSITGYLENYKSVADRVAGIHKELETQRGEIAVGITEIEKIYANNEVYGEKIKRLEEIFTTGDDYDSKLDTLYKSMLLRKKEMDTLYYDIIGYKDTDKNSGEEIVITGKKEELEKSYESLKESLAETETKLAHIESEAQVQYNTFDEQKNFEFATAFQKWQEQYAGITKRIETLLPNALTAGLSSAYSKKKEDEIKESGRYSKTFSNAILGLVGVSLIPFAISIISLVRNDTLLEVLLRLPRLVLSILPLYIPVLWVAYSANKKVNLSKRLSEEYAHKEVLSKTFEGLSKQIQDIENKSISNDLRNKLLYNILEVSSENPGKLISDYNKSDHPLMDALDKSVKLANAVEKLAKIPGLSKLANVLDRKSKDVLSEEGRKADAGLQTIEDA